MIMNLIYRKCRTVAESRPPDFVMGHDYCHRWHLIPRNRFFNVYLHRFLRSDDRVMHDHPWWNLSFVLHGTYEDHTKDKMVVCGPGRLKLRSAAKAHRIELIGGECWSLFLTGPVMREWGIHCPQGWKSWRELSDGKGHVIHGCD